MQRPRILACDIDGTLLDAGVLLPDVVEAVERIVASGVLVVLATGRSPWYGVAELSRRLGLSGPQVTMQGALVTSPDSGAVHRMRPLPEAIYRRALAFARAHGLDPVVAAVDGHRAERLGSAEADFVAPVAATHLVLVDDLAEVATQEPLRVYLPISPDRHGELVAAALERFRGLASVTWSDESGLEILAARTDKGRAVAWLAATYGIGPDEIAAVGDARNDLELLRMAGRSAAMENAPAFVRAAADVVVPTAAQLGVLQAFDWLFPDLDLAPSVPALVAMESAVA